MAVALAVLASPAGAARRARPGRRDPRRPSAGGRLAVRRAARAGAARRGPSRATSASARASSSRPPCPSSRCASTRPAPSTVTRARSCSCRRPRPASIVRVDLGRCTVGRRVVATWPAGTSLAPGRYRVRLHVRGLRGTVLARKASTPGLTTLTVRAPEPAPAPLPDRRRARLPRRRPAHLRRRLRRRRATATRTRARTSRPPRASPVVAPVAGSISFTDYQAKAAGYYIVEKGCRRLRLLLRPLPEGLDRRSRPSRPWPPASRCATSAPRATRPGRICTSRLGRADGGSMRAHTPSTRCRCSRAGTSAQRQPQLAGDAGELGPRPGGHIADAGADELRDLGGQDARTQAGGQRAGGAGGVGAAGAAAAARRFAVGSLESTSARAVDAGAGDERAVLRDRVGAVACLSMLRPLSTALPASPASVSMRPSLVAQSPGSGGSKRAVRWLEVEARARDRPVGAEVAQVGLEEAGELVEQVELGSSPAWRAKASVCAGSRSAGDERRAAARLRRLRAGGDRQVGGRQAHRVGGDAERHAQLRSRASVEHGGAVSQRAAPGGVGELGRALGEQRAAGRRRRARRRRRAGRRSACRRSRGRSAPAGAARAVERAREVGGARRDDDHPVAARRPRRRCVGRGAGASVAKASHALPASIATAARPPTSAWTWSAVERAVRHPRRELLDRQRRRAARACRGRRRVGRAGRQVGERLGRRRRAVPSSSPPRSSSTDRRPPPRGARARRRAAGRGGGARRHGSADPALP